jgi:predicted nucleic acid-binding Zn ribbon protein
MPEPLPPHTHCLTCDIPIPETESFCSDTCKADYDKKIKKSKRTMLYFYVVAIVVIVGISFVTLIFG